MNKQKSYDFIHVGLLVRYNSHLNSESKKETILKGLSSLQKALSKIPFTVSLAALGHLIEKLTEKTGDINPRNKLDLESFNMFQNNIRSLENTIFAEALTKVVHTIPLRRYMTEYLLEKPEMLLKNEVFGKLTDMAKFDFTSACRCISYGEATASAFHILRATEDTLKQYYFKYKKTKRLAKPMWGPMTAELRAKKTNRPNETVLSSLDVVRVSYRNPTQHPDIKYDIESAQDLLGVCIDLLNKMAVEL